MVLKETGAMIGQCGLTRQRVEEQAATLLGSHPQLWLHGGGAEALRDRLPPHRLVADAVLRGLARWQAQTIA